MDDFQLTISLRKIMFPENPKKEFQRVLNVESITRLWEKKHY